MQCSMASSVACAAASLSSGILLACFFAGQAQGHEHVPGSSNLSGGSQEVGTGSHDGRAAPVRASRLAPGDGGSAFLGITRSFHGTSASTDTQQAGVGSDDGRGVPAGASRLAPGAGDSAFFGISRSFHGTSASTDTQQAGVGSDDGRGAPAGASRLAPGDGDSAFLGISSSLHGTSAHTHGTVLPQYLSCIRLGHPCKIDTSVDRAHQCAIGCDETTVLTSQDYRRMYLCSALGASNLCEDQRTAAASPYTWATATSPVVSEDAPSGVSLNARAISTGASSSGTCIDRASLRQILGMSEYLPASVPAEECTLRISEGGGSCLENCEYKDFKQEEYGDQGRWCPRTDGKDVGKCDPGTCRYGSRIYEIDSAQDPSCRRDLRSYKEGDHNLPSCPMLIQECLPAECQYAGEVCQVRRTPVEGKRLHCFHKCSSTTTRTESDMKWMKSCNDPTMGYEEEGWFGIDHKNLQKCPDA